MSSMSSAESTGRAGTGKSRTQGGVPLVFSFRSFGCDVVCLTGLVLIRFCLLALDKSQDIA